MAKDTSSHVVQDARWAAALWPDCRNITIHGPNSPQQPAKPIRKAAMVGFDPPSEVEKYSFGVLWLCLALIGCATAVGLVRRWRTSYPLTSNRLLTKTKAGSIYLSLLACFRLVGYGSYSVPLGRCWGKLSLPQTNRLFVIAASFLALTAWCFSVKPYYRCTREWGAPPLGLRAGLIANGFIPIIIALGTKVNLVTLLTNLSYERLQIFHQWAARLMLFFAIVHMLPFIIQPLRDGGTANLHAYYIHSGKHYYWTGSVALAMVAWIVASSAGVFRRLSYELFIAQHIVSVMIFIGFYFKHTWTEEVTVVWRWTSLALWATASLLRWARTMYTSKSLIGREALLEVQHVSNSAERFEGDEFVRVTFNMPATWSPGQHVFIQFPTLGFLQPHPFTLFHSFEMDANDQPSKATLLARARKGLTRSLYDAAQNGNHDRQIEAQPVPALNGSGSTSPVEEKDEGSDICDAKKLSPGPRVGAIKQLLLRATIDGPYGTNASVASFGGAVFVAGGSGFTLALAMLQDLANRCKTSSSHSSASSQDKAGAVQGQAKGLCTVRIAILWSVRTPATLAWIKPQLERILDRLAAAGIMLDVQIHITRDQNGEQHGEKDAVAATAAAASTVTGARVHRGRLETAAACDAALDSMSAHGAKSVALVICCPDSMAAAAQHSAVKAQRDILRGRRFKDLREVYMLKDNFGW